MILQISPPPAGFRLTNVKFDALGTSRPRPQAAQRQDRAQRWGDGG